MKDAATRDANGETLLDIGNNTDVPAGDIASVLSYLSPEFQQRQQQKQQLHGITGI